jgi:hypothetical protein
MEKTREELQHELDLKEAIRLEREITDKLYAIKLVEQIVFGMVGLILIAVVTALVSKLVEQIVLVVLTQ